MLKYLKKKDKSFQSKMLILAVVDLELDFINTE